MRGQVMWCERLQPGQRWRLQMRIVSGLSSSQSPGVLSLALQTTCRCWIPSPQVTEHWNQQPKHRQDKMSSLVLIAENFREDLTRTAVSAEQLTSCTCVQCYVCFNAAFGEREHRLWGFTLCLHLIVQLRKTALQIKNGFDRQVDRNSGRWGWCLLGVSKNAWWKYPHASWTRRQSVKAPLLQRTLYNRRERKK